jgi:hypothetical protein
MRWKDLGRRFAGLFPAVGGALGGPAGALAGSMLAQKLGVDSTPEAIEAALVNDPAAYAKLRDLDADLAQARMRDTQHAREIGKGHWMPAVLTVVLVAVWLSLVAMLVFVNIPPAQSDQVYFLVGTWSGFTGAAITYWLGSSRGSAEKQSTIDGIARSEAVLPAVTGAFRRG